MAEVVAVSLRDVPCGHMWRRRARTAESS